MSQPIAIFRKNQADYTLSQVSATASEASSFASFVLNRNNSSAWVTTGSVDANHTTLTIDMADQHTLTDILLVKHNFKSFQVKYWDGSAYVDFSPAISPTSCTDSTSRFSFAAVGTSRVQVTILGTQTPDTDKFLYQLILTQLIGQFQAWPIIKKPTHNRNKRNSLMLSGKNCLGENVGAFSCDLQVGYWKSDQDLSVVETMYGSNEGFLVWLCGGDETQFSSKRVGYRLEDIYLMKCTNNYQPEWYQGIYTTGLNLTISLAEVTN